MKRVLIVNPCGLLAAMPTEEEYRQFEYPTQGCVCGLVEVSDQDTALIYENRTRVKVLMPGLPAPNEQGLYIAVLNGRIVVVGEQLSNINIQKKAENTLKILKKIRAFFGI